MRILALFILSVFAMDNSFKEEVDRILEGINSPMISIKEFKMLKKKIIVDVREKKEFSISHIQFAKNYPYSDFSFEEFQNQYDKKTPIIIYCSVGYRSGKIAEKLNKYGYKVFNLYGGIFNWVNSKEKVYNSNGQTKEIHTYNKKWSQLVKFGKKVY